MWRPIVLALVFLVGIYETAHAISPEKARHSILRMVVGDRLIGTGFHIGNNYVLTNQHVCETGWKRSFVKDPETGRTVEEVIEYKMEVVTFTGYRYTTEMVREGNMETGLDLCLLRMNPHDMIVLPNAMEEVASETPRIGAEVWSMGMPSGDYWIYTFGRMSHPWYPGQETPRHILVMPGVGGQSGSPAFDEHGAFIGVVSQIIVTQTGPMSRAPTGYTLIIPKEVVLQFLMGV